MSEAAPRRRGRSRGLGLGWVVCVLLVARCALAQAGAAAPQATNPEPPAAPAAQAAAHAGDTLAAASPYRGVVTFGGLPLPGATVTATQGTTTVTVVSDAAGTFQFDDLADGKWSIDIQMQLFAPVHADVTIAPNLPAAAYELKLLDPAQIQASAQAAKPVAEAPAPVPAVAQGPQTSQTPQAQQAQQPQGKQPAQSTGQAAPQEIPKAPEENEQSADGFLVQGSVNNAATSLYATNPAFGNTRSGSKGLYTGGFQVNESNSALNAQPYALSGAPTTKSSFNDFTGVAALQGPFKIPHLLPRGPNFFLAYVWTRNSSSQILTGLVPTQAEQSGNLAGLTNALGQPVTIHEPGTSTPYTNNQVPVSAQAAYLLSHFYKPLVPNVTGSTAYNYQAPVLNDTHQDSLQSRFDKNLGRKDNFNGRLGFQSTRSDNVNLFGFVDESSTLGMNTNVQWQHRLKPRVFLYTTFTFSRNRTEVTPNFANRQNVSGAAGITAGSLANLQAPGNLQDAADWGPPSLSFSDGTAGLSDGNSSFNRNRNDDVSVSTLIYRGKHNISAGAELNKREFNDDFQQNPRGAFTFNGLATASGSALADFLVGVPDGSAIAYGNANKYFREPVYNAYINDDWRVLPILTINAGLRWDYGAPITELFGNLVNLDVNSSFTAAEPVVGSDPVGPVTGTHYPSSLIEPERRMIEPRIGVTWRPIPASTVVIKAGYGLYPDTSVYQNIILNMAQQAPLSKSLSVENSTACPLTLANSFTPCASVTSDTFGIDPNFRVGYAQNWQLSVQRDLPFALQMTATYSGIKGTHGPQEILPNSYPGNANPCPSCPLGFEYETSNGNSIREAGQLQLRRRLRSGFAATLSYTYAKSIDDDAYLGGVGHQTASGGAAQSASLSFPSAAIAQNWLDPQAERSLSSFDQRQLLNLTAQYTSGQGLEGGTLLGGWRGRALKEWTVLGNLTYGTGLPETPVYPLTVSGTDFAIGRPELTGTPIYSSGSGSGLHLNLSAYEAPSTGQWGTAGRNSITGPDQFTLDTSMARTFRPKGKWYLDVSVNATNTFNHAAFTGWNTIWNLENTQFGRPTSAGGMRSLQTTFHLRWQ
ncbi:MAG: carboxypeptidase regulatory-like domain-containing protein [Terracidiphilus sp.]